MYKTNSNSLSELWTYEISKNQAIIKFNYESYYKNIYKILCLSNTIMGLNIMIMSKYEFKLYNNYLTKYLKFHESDSILYIYPMKKHETLLNANFLDDILNTYYLNFDINSIKKLYYTDKNKLEIIEREIYPAIIENKKLLLNMK